MKAGDTVWVWIRQRYVGTDPDGYRMFDMANPGNPIPDHPALPAVARWLAADDQKNDRRLYSVCRDALEAGLLPRGSVDEQWIVALLAALTTEETA